MLKLLKGAIHLAGGTVIFRKQAGGHVPDGALFLAAQDFGQVVPSMATSCPCRVPMLTGATEGRCVSAQPGPICVICCVLWKMARSSVSWRWCWPCHQHRVTGHQEGRVTSEQGAIATRCAVA